MSHNGWDDRSNTTGRRRRTSGPTSSSLARFRECARGDLNNGETSEKPVFRNLRRQWREILERRQGFPRPEPFVWNALGSRCQYHKASYNGACSVPVS